MRLKQSGNLVLLGVLAFPMLLSALWWDNGTFGVSLNDYGRIRIYTEPADIKHIERFSILVGMDAGGVFDYQMDADVVAAPDFVTPATFGDVEGYGAVDNAWSMAPPDVLVKINLYGWNSGDYVLFKFTVFNTSNRTLNAVIGHEMIPVVNGQWQNPIKYYSEHDLFAATGIDTTIEVGFKYFSPELASLSHIDYFSGYYESDSLLYANLNHTNIDTYFLAADPVEGSVTFAGTGPVTIESTNDSAIVYVGIALGNDSTAMVANMAALEAHYGELGTAPVQTILPERISLAQNYPNPFNPGTQIGFELSQSGPVSLQVHDLQGRLVRTLVDATFSPGAYTLQFRAGDLPSGVYFYTLQTGETRLTRKMLLLK